MIGQLKVQSFLVMNLVITDRIRKKWGRQCFHRCVPVHTHPGGGVPPSPSDNTFNSPMFFLWGRGTPPPSHNTLTSPRSLPRQRYPSQIPVPDGGYPILPKTGWGYLPIET